MGSGVNYNDYLCLDKLLSIQNRESEKFNRAAHDEMLFIIVHQTYELWFKQILFELESVINLFGKDQIAETDLTYIVPKLKRVVSIQNLIAQQIDVLETMSPLDFLEFRDLLYPASGFQSIQFRLIENKLGLLSKDRLTYNNQAYCQHFPENEKAKLQSSEKEKSLIDCVHSWLERTPFLQIEDFDFWKEYQSSVSEMFIQELNLIQRNKTLSEEAREKSISQIQKSKSIFDSFFKKEEFEALRESATWRLSYKALHSTLFIQLYHNEPALHLPYELINTLIEIDQNLTEWRYRHAMMVKRMLGSKVGTGGSSGAEYLKTTAEKHKIFSDFLQLTTFLVPQSRVPKLPKKLKRQLGFVFEIK